MLIGLSVRGLPVNEERGKPLLDKHESQACLLNQDQDQIQDPAEKDPDKNLHEEPVLCLDQDPDLGVYENLAYWFMKVKPVH